IGRSVTEYDTSYFVLLYIQAPFSWFRLLQNVSFSQMMILCVSLVILHLDLDAFQGRVRDLVPEGRWREASAGKTGLCPSLPVVLLLPLVPLVPSAVVVRLALVGMMLADANDGVA